MSGLRKVPSTMFRVIYAQLDEPVAVTALGRVIGWYTPAANASDPQAAGAESVPLATAPAMGTRVPIAGMTQKERDKVLGRMGKT